jgi:hypothetical protein
MYQSPNYLTYFTLKMETAISTKRGKPSTRLYCDTSYKAATKIFKTVRNSNPRQLFNFNNNYIPSGLKFMAHVLREKVKNYPHFCFSTLFTLK